MDTQMDLLKAGGIGWYDFKENSRILLLEEKVNQATMEMLKNKSQEIISCRTMDEFKRQYKGIRPDYIIAISILEKEKNPVLFLQTCFETLTEEGILLLGVENRFGFRFFCGDRDPFTDRNFDGIENYRTFTGKKEGRCYAEFEVKNFLNNTDWDTVKSYAVLPSLNEPQLIYAKEYNPREDLSVRYNTRYHYPESVFLEEEQILKDLIANDMFHQTANAYLFECKKTVKDTMNPVLHVTLSSERGKEEAMATIIYKSGVVEKKPLFSEGKEKLKRLAVNEKELQKHGIHILPGTLEENSYKMPYVDAPTGLVYLKKLFWDDSKKFIEEIDRFRMIIMQSSEITDRDNKDGTVSKILKKGYFDLVPLNCFFVDGNYIFFDQEFVIENCPADLILTRVLEILYLGNSQMEKKLSKQTFIKKYGLEKSYVQYQTMEADFLQTLRHQKEMCLYLNAHGKNMPAINTNRQRMNYSEEEYQKLFIRLFDHTKGKKIYLFGSGRFARRFVARFGTEVNVVAMLDNNQEKQGQTVDGIPVESPDVLKTLSPDEYKVIICIKQYPPIMQQLAEMGVKNYGVYDAYVPYPVKKREISGTKETPKETPAASAKKYHVGYIAGVFDLFHVGHVNLLRRAKEQCDYLIVGVVSDEAVRKNKKVDPFIPFEERREMVQACKYVDEAVEIPFAASGTRDAYWKYRFDVQFSGSDYAKDPVWLAEKEFLHKQGAELVFFPYTQATSSSKIKKLIEEKLL